MNKPKTIKAYAIVDKSKPKFGTMDIYSPEQIKGIMLNKKEVICEVEIRFIKYKKP